MSFTGLVDNKPIADQGVFHLWDGVAEGWVLATKEIYKYPVFCAKHIKKRTEMLIKNNNIKRLQTSVKADCEMAFICKMVRLRTRGTYEKLISRWRRFY